MDWAVLALLSVRSWLQRIVAPQCARCGPRVRSGTPVSPCIASAGEYLRYASDLCAPHVSRRSFVAGRAAE